MNNRRRKLIENIKVEVPNTVLISKDILLHVSKFLEKMVFQLIFKIIKWIWNLQLRRQTSKMLVSDRTNFLTRPGAS